QFFLDKNEYETDDREPNHNRSRDRRLEEEQGQNQPERHKQTTLEKLPGGGPPRADHGPVVETLRFENEWGSGDQEEGNPDVGIQGHPPRFQPEQVRNVFIRPDNVGQWEADCEKARIQQLVNLHPNLAIAAEHASVRFVRNQRFAVSVPSARGVNWNSGAAA